MNNMKKYLDFNGTQIPFALIDGKYWVAIKPICEALGVDYIRQFKNLKSDEILGQLLSKQTITGADDKLYKMISLPERYVYGWIFSLQSKSEALVAYKMKCYDVLYDYFHGTLTRRQELLLQKAELLDSNEKTRAELGEDLRFRSIRENENQVRKINAELKAQDVKIMSGQGDLFAGDAILQ
jgi:hypothetical protein